MQADRTPRAVAIRRLKLDRFRNYRSLDLPVDPRHVVLTGDNGAGKTNLLEAISFLSPGRGLRRAAYDQVARRADDEAPTGAAWAVNATLDGAFGEVSIGTGLRAGPESAERQRRIHIDGTAARSADVLLDHCRVLWLTPAMDGLFTGPPGDRRRFLDRLVLAIDPDHGRRVTEFEKAMRGRNRVLETPSPDPVWLDGLETQMAETGTAITIARLEAVALMSGLDADEHRSGRAPAFPRADISVEGTIEQSVTVGASADAEDLYRALLARNRPRDRAAGRTLEGPHRSDLKITHIAKGMEAAVCSTGEQKALLLGLVLAHATLVGRVAGMAPLLLLDEVAAHLDADRRAALFDLIDSIGVQAWMTGTDAQLFDALAERAQHFRVDAGTVSAAPSSA